MGAPSGPCRPPCRQIPPRTYAAMNSLHTKVVLSVAERRQVRELEAVRHMRREHGCRRRRCRWALGGAALYARRLVLSASGSGCAGRQGAAAQGGGEPETAAAAGEAAAAAAAAGRAAAQDRLALIPAHARASCAAGWRAGGGASVIIPTCCRPPAVLQAPGWRLDAIVKSNSSKGEALRECAVPARHAQQAAVPLAASPSPQALNPGPSTTIKYRAPSAEMSKPGAGVEQAGTRLEGLALSPDQTAALSAEGTL